MNLSILDQNIIYAFGGLAHTDEAERVYLAKRDRLPPLQSEQAAWKWEAICRVIVPGLRHAEAAHGGQDNGVLDFIRTRFLNAEMAA